MPLSLLVIVDDDELHMSPLVKTKSVIDFLKLERTVIERNFPVLVEDCRDEVELAFSEKGAQLLFKQDVTPNRCDDKL
ncbi:hypothetical protein GTP58_20190 [Duganella sp. CY15W]|uniref:hypothetical protein n=1 Tax=Duganella sp. CY15W TaxID=2692172 RepID=UPI00136D13BA|nr:hypothetical protein [Duganella sp. CY15W]MYM30656.1 hypothetical protein [Duganella sp. CY15W]